MEKIDLAKELEIKHLKELLEQERRISADYMRRCIDANNTLKEIRSGKNPDFVKRELFEAAQLRRDVFAFHMDETTGDLINLLEGMIAANGKITIDEVQSLLDFYNDRSFLSFEELHSEFISACDKEDDNDFLGE